MNRTILQYSFFLLLISLIFNTSLAYSKTNFKVLTFNIWVGGDGSGFTKEKSIANQLQVIRATKADIVAFQEQTSYKFGEHSRAQLLADSLGWNCIVIDKSRAVISKYPLSRLKDDKSQVLKVDINGNTLLVADVHLPAYPYEPYEIADSKLKDEQSAIQSAINSRGNQIQSVVADLKGFENLPTIILGDFNEPSYYDWTKSAIQKRNDPRLTFSVKWPSTSLLLENGFYDAYRKLYKNVQKRPSYTWTSIPSGSIENEVYDRIDLIFANKKVKAKSAKIVGEKADAADLVIAEWPTDHRAVLMDMTF
ncbi:endonuclease/exonuclease/phosphatase family protein [Sphingobacterium cellulitidis]|uniref:endonuclease/exonuclease/phosphatase family protein n=1 Tax=Sphingobacterium cellulitidis TaxID=1768011 RepID=UPI003C798994